MSFQNLYYERAVATPRPCAVCLRPTTIVLSTMGNVDFIYTCERHLTDPGFASKLPEAGALPTPKAPVDDELVKEVKEEWEEKQRRKKEKEDKDQKEKDKDKKDEKGKDKKASTPTSPSPPVTPSAPAAPTHQKYVLHRSIFAARQLEHRKRRQAREAKEVAPRLPGVP
ncbi:DUF1742-domain-containing protein, partial [Calocera viscosa TUFC12733]